MAWPPAGQGRARRSAVAARRGPAAARGDRPADEDAAAGGRDGRAAHADLGAGALRRRRGRSSRHGRRTARRCGSPARSPAWSRPGAGCRPAAGRSRPIPRSATPPTSSTCSPASARAPTAVRAMDIALMLHADHELNASTFAARVAAATLTDIHSAVVAGIGTLKGPLHGGANAEVMKMLLEIGKDAPPERSDAYRARQARSARRRCPASATASTRPRTRAPRTCARCRRSSGARPGEPRVVRDVASGSRRW